MKTKKLAAKVAAFSDTYDSLIECFGTGLPDESIAGHAGLPLEVIKALVLCKVIERSVDQLDTLLLKYPNVSALGFAGSGKAHLINVYDDDTMFVTYDNFDIFENKDNDGQKQLT